MRGFTRLLKKDLESIQQMAVIQGIGIILWDMFYYSRVGSWKAELAVGPTVVPFALVFFWLVMQAVQVYRHEWQIGGIYQTLTLPQPGWKIALAKLTAVMIGFTVNAILAALGFLAVLMAAGGLSLLGPYGDALRHSTIVRTDAATLIAGFALVYWLFGLHMAIIIQAGYNCMRLATTKWRFLLGISFFTLLWVQNLCGAIGYHLFTWIPDLAIKIPQYAWNVPDGIQSTHTIRVFLNSGIILGQTLGLVLIFWLTGYLIQNVMEA